MLLTTLIAALALFPTDPSILTIPTAEAAPQTIQIQRLAWLQALSACEDPEGDPNIRVLDTNGRFSYSLYQYQMATWLRECRDFGATESNIYEPDRQRACTAYILDNGGADHWWTCSRQVRSKLGPWPITQPAAP